MRIVPLTLKEANDFVDKFHRHNRSVTGHKWSVGAMDGERLVGVAIVGRTVARMAHSPLTAEVLRCCVLDDAPKGACSFLYGACKRIWQQMGGTRLITYTLEKEAGASLRGAGWETHGKVKTRDNPWGSKDRSREMQEVFNEPKLRWEAPIKQ